MPTQTLDFCEYGGYNRLQKDIQIGVTNMETKISKKDIVSWISGGKTFYGRVIGISGNSALITVYGMQSEKRVSVSKLKYEPAVRIDVKDLGRFARFEIGYRELMRGRTFADIEIFEKYEICPDDLVAAAANFRRSGISDDDFAGDYFFPIWCGMGEALDLSNALGENDDGYENVSPPNRVSVMRTVWTMFVKRFNNSADGINLDDAAIEVQTWKKNENKPFSEREYTLSQKWDFIEYWNDDRLLSADDDIKEAYRKILDSLCDADDKEALKIKAYACYGHGNAAYGQNWPESQKCLLRLMEIAPDPQIANTLGYMFYYGRCTDGIPEYDKAFYYFSIGAAGYYYESRYKLSDMFKNGYGVAKNPEAAAGLIWELYNEQLDKICDGQFNSEFADVALRAGGLLKDGINCIPNADRAFCFYLQAKYAIRMRMLATDSYGDRRVAAAIDHAIDDILPNTEYAKRKKTVHLIDPLLLLCNALGKNHHLEMKIKKISDSEAKLTFRIVPYENGETQPKIFVTIPEAHFCGLLPKVCVKAEKIKEFEVAGETDTVYFDSVNFPYFTLYGKKVAKINADFVFTAPKNGGKKRRFVSVVFAPGGKRYDYLSDIPFNVGDKAIVRTSDGETAATVVAVFEKTESELALPLGKYKKIVRAAN